MSHVIINGFVWSSKYWYVLLLARIRHDWEQAIKNEDEETFEDAYEEIPQEKGADQMKTHSRII